MKFEIKSVQNLKRFLLISGLTSVLLTILLIYLLTESIGEVLTKTPWCLKKIEYKSKLISPNTTRGGNPIIVNNCLETIEFKRTGELLLPGFNTAAVSAKWAIREERIQIHSANNFNDIYNGTYEIYHQNGSLELSSETTHMWLISNKKYLNVY